MGIAKTEDPKIVCHPCLTILADTVWNGIAGRSFLGRKSWFVFTLFLFIISQAVLKNIDRTDDNADSMRYTIFACRLFMYVFSMGQMIYVHLSRIFKAYRAAQTIDDMEN